MPLSRFVLLCVIIFVAAVLIAIGVDVASKEAGGSRPQETVESP